MRRAFCIVVWNWFEIQFYLWNVKTTPTVKRYQNECQSKFITNTTLAIRYLSIYSTRCKTASTGSNVYPQLNIFVILHRSMKRNYMWKPPQPSTRRKLQLRLCCSNQRRIVRISWSCKNPWKNWTKRSKCTRNNWRNKNKFPILISWG